MVKSINTTRRSASRLAGRALARRVTQVMAANHVAAKVDARFDALWKRVLWALQFVRPWHTLFTELQSTFKRLEDLPRFLETELQGATQDGYHHAAEDIATVVLRPKPTQERLVIQPYDVAKLWKSLTDMGAKPVRDAVADMMFPALDTPVVNRIVHATGWEARLRSLTKLGTPQQLASTIAQQVASGGGVRQIAKDLLPQLNGVRASANRVARTEYLRVAQTAQFEAYEQLGDVVIGYQVHGIMDDRIRPEHRLRNGTVYYKLPSGGRKGMNECPQPPMESDGTVAHNCRCFLTPSFNDEESRHGTAGTSIQKANTPQFDPGTVSSWYDTADEGTRRAAVGANRYNLVSDLTQREPKWSDFTSPDGHILTFRQLLSLASKLRTLPGGSQNVWTPLAGVR